MDAIDLYDGSAPGSEDWTHTEQRYFSEALGIEVVTNAVAPTLTPVLPSADAANGAAVIIAPGGAFHLLSIESEGFEVAERLARHGVAAFVLAYRLVPCEGDALPTENWRCGSSAPAPTTSGSIPVELHMYARGGHGFGMRTQHLPSDTWIDCFLD